MLIFVISNEERRNPNKNNEEYQGWNKERVLNQSIMSEGGKVASKIIDANGHAL
jgi:hypothetical protein